MHIDVNVNYILAFIFIFSGFVLPYGVAKGLELIFEKKEKKYKKYYEQK